MGNELTTTENSGQIAGFNTAAGFELIQRQAKVLASSALVPKEFQGNIANCIIGLEIAHRIGASPLAVLQNLYIVHGKPGWSSQFIIGAINSTGKFSPLRFEMSGEGLKRTCVAWATDLATGDRLDSPLVSMDMAKAEGWIDKAGSKWKTMPELMLRYRAATFFGRLYAPEILMGMQTVEEVVDVTNHATGTAAATLHDRFAFDKDKAVENAAAAANGNRQAAPAAAQADDMANICPVCMKFELEGACRNPGCEKYVAPPEA